jgi:hypothetical protein
MVLVIHFQYNLAAARPSRAQVHDPKIAETAGEKYKNRNAQDRGQMAHVAFEMSWIQA